MDGKRQLGEFLQTRRAQLRPEDLGLAVYGGQRRVPGLRREELALLAGVSASYYSRLEQGHLDLESPDRPGQRPNMARLVFLDEHTRELYEDWPAKARAVVGTLRLASGRYPNDPALASLVGELSVNSGEFAALWGYHRVKAGDPAVYRMCHPLVGAMTVTQQALRTEQDQCIVRTARFTSHALVLPAHFSGHGALEVRNDGGAFAIKKWALFTRY